MERSCSPGITKPAGFLTVSTDAKHTQSRKSGAPRTVSIAVTKPSLFGKRPPLRAQPGRIKSRMQGTETEPDTLPAGFVDSADTKILLSGSVTHAQLHPIFATFSQEGQNLQRTVSVPDTEEALSAVCISRLGSSAAAGIGSLPSTPLGGNRAACSSALESLHGRHVNSAVSDLPGISSRPDTLMKNLACVSHSSVRNLMHRHNGPQAVLASTGSPAELDQAPGELALASAFQLQESKWKNAAPSMAAGPNSLPPQIDHTVITPSAESQPRHGNVDEPKCPDQSMGPATVRHAEEDAGMCIMPSCTR